MLSNDLGHPLVDSDIDRENSSDDRIAKLKVAKQPSHPLDHPFPLLADFQSDEDHAVSGARTRGVAPQGADEIKLDLEEEMEERAEGQVLLQTVWSNCAIAFFVAAFVGIIVAIGMGCVYLFGLHAANNQLINPAKDVPGSLPSEVQGVIISLINSAKINCSWEKSVSAKYYEVELCDEE
eukprot:35483_1